MPNPGCPSSCGNVNISYPFGIGDGCYYIGGLFRERFALTCNSSYDPPKLFTGNVEVIEIMPKSPKIRVNLPPSYQCYHNNQTTNESKNWEFHLNDSPFSYSYTENVFTAVGCDTLAFINGTKGVRFTSGCISLCSTNASVSDGNCSGIGCSQTSIPPGFRTYRTSFNSTNNHYGIESFNPCSFSFLVEKSKYNFSKADLDMDKTRKFPVVWDWAIGNDTTCEEARKNKTSYACVSERSECDETSNGYGYYCNCSQGYDGNPYLLNGCQDIDECTEMKSPCGEGGICENKEGNYTCTCPPGTKGDPYKRCENLQSLPTSVKLVLGLGVGVSFFILTISCFHWVHRRRQYIKLKQKFYQQHGGSFLQQQLSNETYHTSNFRIFSEAELKRATNNYDDKNILGKGGHGMVYKGLCDDGNIVAVKKSLIVDESMSNEFAKEMLILSQINHVNVVKLLGCCLEVEVPMMVYEFASNGTLFHYLHHRNLHQPPLTWSFRLKIMAESAKALSYMHSEASPPILHGDIKPSNILLDSNYITKVSDFGTSTLAPKDKSKFMTIIQGTYGYLDPDFLRSGELTDKSDVYSFGVLMVELLTGLKPIYKDEQKKERYLVHLFLSFVKEKKMLEILDKDILNDGNPTYQIEDVVNIAEKCLSSRRGTTINEIHFRRA